MGFRLLIFNFQQLTVKLPGGGNKEKIQGGST